MVEPTPWRAASVASRVGAPGPGDRHRRRRRPRQRQADRELAAPAARRPGALAMPRFTSAAGNGCREAARRRGVFLDAAHHLTDRRRRSCGAGAARRTRARPSPTSRIMDGRAIQLAAFRESRAPAPRDRATRTASDRRRGRSITRDRRCERERSLAKGLSGLTGALSTVGHAPPDAPRVHCSAAAATPRRRGIDVATRRLAAIAAPRASSFANARQVGATARTSARRRRRRRPALGRASASRRQREPRWSDGARRRHASAACRRCRSLLRREAILPRVPCCAATRRPSRALASPASRIVPADRAIRGESWSRSFVAMARDPAGARPVAAASPAIVQPPSRRRASFWPSARRFGLHGVAARRPASPLRAARRRTRRCAALRALRRKARSGRRPSAVEPARSRAPHARRSRRAVARRRRPRADETRSRLASSSSTRFARPALSRGGRMPRRWARARAAESARCARVRASGSRPGRAVCRVVTGGAVYSSGRTTARRLGNDDDSPLYVARLARRATARPRDAARRPRREPALHRRRAGGPSSTAAAVPLAAASAGGDRQTSTSSRWFDSAPALPPATSARARPRRRRRSPVRGAAKHAGRPRSASSGGAGAAAERRDPRMPELRDDARAIPAGARSIVPLEGADHVVLNLDVAMAL